MKTATKLVHLTSAGIAFSAEIGGAIGDLYSGKWASNPTAALQDILVNATGIQSDGSINPSKLTFSIFAKVGGLAFDKIAMHFVRKLRL